MMTLVRTSAEDFAQDHTYGAVLGVCPLARAIPNRTGYEPNQVSRKQWPTFANLETPIGYYDMAVMFPAPRRPPPAPILAEIRALSRESERRAIIDRPLSQSGPSEFWPDSAPMWGPSLQFFCRIDRQPSWVSCEPTNEFMLP